MNESCQFGRIGRIKTSSDGGQAKHTAESQIRRALKVSL
jgi:hypothetical protein